MIDTARNPAVVAGWNGGAWVTMFDAGEVWQLRPPEPLLTQPVGLPH